MDNATLLSQMSNASVITNEQVKDLLLGLDDDQLNWRPDDNTWSIGQQFHHMVLTNRQYVAIIEHLAATSGENRKHYAPGFWGKFMFKAVGPHSTMNAPVPKPLIPSSGKINSEIVKEYLELQDRFDRALEAAQGKDLTQRFSSPFAKLVKLKFGDAIQMVVLHNQRHVGKAAAMLNRPEFPRKAAVRL